MKLRSRSLTPLLVATAVALLLAVLYVRRNEGFQSASSATSTVTDTATAQPIKSTLWDFLLNPPEWLIWTIVILLIIGGVIRSIMTTYNWYRGVSAGVSAVGNLSSAGANWIRAKANKNRANAMRGNSSNSV